MKKFGILAVSLAAMFALGLCGACGDNQGEENGGHDPADSAGFTMTKETDLRSLTSDEVTGEEWKAVFAAEKFDNFLLTYTYDTPYEDAYVEGAFDGKKADFSMYRILEDGEKMLGQHMLMSETDGKVSAWNEIEGELVFDGDDYTPESGEIPYSYRAYILALKEKYSSFVYDAAKKCYTTTEAVFLSEGTTGVIIKDGVLCGIWADVLKEEGRPELGTSAVDCIVYDFGKASVTFDVGEHQHITLTEDTDFEALISDRVTQEEWRAIYSEENFKNVTLRETRGDIGGADDQRAKMYLDWEETRMTLEGRFNMVSVVTIPTPDGEYDSVGGQMIENGVCTQYQTFDKQTYYMQYGFTPEKLAEWEKYMMLDGEYSFFYATLIATDFSDYYKEFTYNEELGAYLYEAPEGSDGLKFRFTAGDGMGTNLKYVELKFTEGRVAYVHWRSDNISKDVYHCYYDYGKTKVVPPENALPYPEG